MTYVRCGDETQPLLRQQFVDKPNSTNSSCNVSVYGNTVEEGEDVVDDKPPVAESKDSKLEVPLTRETRNMIYAVYTIAVLMLFIVGTTRPMKLLYQQKVGFVTENNVQFYVKTTVIFSAIDAIGRAVIGTFASIVGPPRALATWGVLIAIGLLGLISTPPSKLGFLCAWTLFSLYGTTRVARILMITKNVPVRYQTAVMSFHSLMSPIGTLLGPLLWIACDSVQTDINLIGGIRFNKFTLNYFNACLLALGVAFVASVFLRVPSDRTDSTTNLNYSSNTTNSATGSTQSNSHNRHDQILNVVLSDGRRYEVSVWKYKIRVWSYFLMVQILLSVSLDLYRFGLQPILVNKYQASGREIGFVYALLATFALIPPFIIAMLSNYLKDRQIMVIGICTKFVGILMLQPIFGSQIYKWQIVAGFIFISKASMFTMTASTTLFMKLLGGMANGTLLGFLSSLTSLSCIPTEFYFAKMTLSYFGTFSYAIFALPIAVSLGLVLWPGFWHQLDPDSEFIRNLLAEYDRVRAHVHQI